MSKIVKDLYIKDKNIDTKYMYQRRSRKFRHRSNGRNYQSRSNGNMQGRLRSQLFSNDQPRNNFRTVHNPEKLLEKYKELAKEALSVGDKTLSENYLQHADHYMRLVDNKNKNQQLNKEQNKNEIVATKNVSEPNINSNLENNTKEKKE